MTFPKTVYNAQTNEACCGQRAEDGDDQGDGERHHDDRAHPRAHPDDENRPEGRLGQRVEHHEIRVENPGELFRPPHADGDRRPQQRPGQKAHHRLQARRPDVDGQLPAAAERGKRPPHPRGTAQQKAVGESDARAQLPPEKKRRHQRNLPHPDRPLLAPQPRQIRRPPGRWRTVIHEVPTPSRSR